MAILVTLWPTFVNMYADCLLQDILSTKLEGEPKVKEVLDLAGKVLPHTAPQGKEIITRDTEALKADWEAFIKALAKVSCYLRQFMGWRLAGRFSSKLLLR